MGIESIQDRQTPVKGSLLQAPRNRVRRLCPQEPPSKNTCQGSLDNLYIWSRTSLRNHPWAYRHDLRWRRRINWHVHSHPDLSHLANWRRGSLERLLRVCAAYSLINIVCIHKRGHWKPWSRASSSCILSMLEDHFLGRWNWQRPCQWLPKWDIQLMDGGLFASNLDWCK